MTAGTVSNPEPPHTRAIEPKVKWGAVAAYALGALFLLLVELFTADNNALLLHVVPDFLEIFLLPLVPALASLAAGFAARHQWRSTEVGRTQAPGTSGVNAP